MIQGSGTTATRARKLRKQMSLPEVLLWRALRIRPGGLKFRRQHPAGPYVADFYCHEARLIVEIDGMAHDLGDRPERDRERDRWFADRHFTVIRVAAADVLRDAIAIADALAGTASPLHHAAARRGPPPHAMHGEDLVGAA